MSARRRRWWLASREPSKFLGVIRLLGEKLTDPSLDVRIKRVLSQRISGHRGEKLQTQGINIVGHAAVYTHKHFESV